MKKIILCFLTALIFILPSYAYEETLILFDSSLSMAELDNGIPKYELAAKAASDALESMPDSARIGLRVIGVVMEENIINYLANPAGLCKASYLAVPVQQGSVSEIKKTLGSLFPLGVTPLVNSIDTALKNDFSPNASLKHIILITDGIDECGGDTCRYINDVRSNRNDVKIDVIALGKEVQKLGQLKCLSDLSNGRMITPNTNPSDMKNAFLTLLTGKAAPDKKPDANINIPFLNKKNDGIKYKNVLIEFD